MAVPPPDRISASYLILFVFALLFSASSSQERQLTATKNPGCNENPRCNSSVEVVHVRADGPNDTMHYVWCFHSEPTVLVALTSHEANLSVSWQDFPNASSSVSFTSQPFYSFGVLMSQIYEFNDINDTGLLDPANNSNTYVNKIEMPEVWEMKMLQQNRDFVRLVMDGTWKKNSTSIKNGLIRVELETYRSTDHSPNLPHLLHSSNATLIELSIVNMVTSSGFENSRYAIELTMAANESSSGGIYSRSFKSLDDEHTPGVFTLVDLQTSASKQSGNGGYLQWRPVAYVADERDIINSTETAFYSVKNGSLLQCEGTLLAAFSGFDLNTSLLKAVNVSFGASDDGFYSATNKTIWTFTMGYGHPPDENFSLLIILVMSVCLGLPAVIIVLSGLYVALRRITYRKDDLLLSE
ncbi:glycosylated lysosomal membrane protein B-like [Thrips palmi]|uniref:Glycosylated lysosomal membrane protein B-like n=1 Tax=Thrips palmi TaxID=161013 RepID=A0A6P8YUQ3_THRPL|nr:glycosylated lysosomal membrane protein B-like [Thrips palmi]